jgi:hypothetical protein
MLGRNADRPGRIPFRGSRVIINASPSLVGSVWQCMTSEWQRSPATLHTMTISAQTILGVSRLSVGAVSLLAPIAAARVFGVAHDPSAAWITRLFGSRELVLAAALLAERDGPVQPVAAVGAAIDTLDAASSMIEFARGRISAYTFISGGGGAVVFALLGLATLRRGPQKA